MPTSLIITDLFTMIKALSGALIALTCACANAHLGITSPGNLQPVQGLYIKPSTDGITGDLYVAATENNGVNSQWVADAPVNFMSGYGQAQPVAYSSSLTAATSPHEQVLTTQKRAVITSPPVQYTYAIPATSTESAKAVYPNVATNGTPTNGFTSQYPEGYPMAYSPYQYMYPYLMQAAAASAANALKDLGLCEELANAVTSQSASMWSPSTSHAYPWQYMMDPKMWSQHAAVAAPTTPVPTPEENKENVNQDE